MILRLPLFTLLLALLVQAGPAQANCRLALLLALDVSSSVSEDEYALQQKGLASALMSEDVLRAILDDREGSVALSVFEWSGRYQQSVVVDWTILDSRAAVLDAANQIAQSTRSYSRFPTSMGFSLGYGAGLFKQAPPCDRRVMDVSGDGINNEGFSPALAYRNFPLDEVTVNGLTIGGAEDDLVGYYKRELIKGPGAFVEQARDFNDFEQAIQRKLVRELQARALSLGPSVTPDSRSPKDG